MPIQIIDIIKQKDNLPFPIADSNDVLGGFHQVDTLVERDSIHNERRRELMFCAVKETGKTYQLRNGTDNTCWVDINVVIGGGGSGGETYYPGTNITISSDNVISATEQTEENYTSVEKSKLSNIEENANNYIHPTNHPAHMITQNDTHRFVTDTQITNWNNKLDEHGNLGGGNLHSPATETVNGFMSCIDKSNLNTIWDAYNTGILGGATLISREGTELCTATELNFTGSDVNVSCVNGVATINISGDSISIETGFNQSPATVDDVSLTGRIIAQPNSEGDPYEIGNWDSTSIHGCINSNIITYSTNDLCDFLDTFTTIEAQILNASGSILQSFTTPAIDNDYSSTQNGITISVNGWSSINSYYQGNIQVDYNLDTLLPNGGRFGVKIIHHNSSAGDYVKEQNNMFYDPNTQMASINTITVGEGTLNSNKYLSGIRYLSNNDTISLSITGIDYINYLTYDSNNVLRINPSDFGVNPYNIGVSALGSWNTHYNHTGATYFTEIDINASAGFTQADPTQTSIVTAQVLDWDNGPLVESNSVSMVIDTNTPQSSADSEYFVDENYRMTSSWTTWNSTQLLSQTDLMVAGGKLQRQYGNWTSTVPSNTAVYSSNSETQYFYRGFQGPTNFNSYSAILHIGGITEAQFNNQDIRIAVSVDDINWYYCDEDYFGMSGMGGARMNPDSEVFPDIQIGFVESSTNASTGPGGWGIYVWVEIPSGIATALESLYIVEWR